MPLAVVWAAGKCWGYLEDSKFQLYTDNISLQWLHSLSSTESKMMSWALMLDTLILIHDMSLGQEIKQQIVISRHCEREIQNKHHVGQEDQS